jgi:hypothetical protein
MSLDIRYITNGSKTIYRVIDGVTDSFNIYKNRDDIPKSIRHYAPEGEPKFVGPDMAAILGVRDILYPNLEDCGHPDYLGKRCIAESCKFAVDKDWTKCPYYRTK